MSPLVLYRLSGRVVTRSRCGPPCENPPGEMDVVNPQPNRFVLDAAELAKVTERACPVRGQPMPVTLVQARPMRYAAKPADGPVGSIDTP